MIEINIPGRGSVRLEHLVTDVNGTLAIDGQLIAGVAKQISSLGDRLTIHMLTADTHGRQALIDQQLNLTAVRIQPGNESEQKAEYVRRLGTESVMAIGQGANDASPILRRSREASDKFCHPENGRFFLIEDSGQIVGCVSLLFVVSTALGGKAALLEDLVLDTSARGQGWGTQLLDYAIQYDVRHGCRRITVLTDKDNSAAQSIYQKMGFNYSEMIPMRLVFKIPPDPPFSKGR